MIDKDNVADSHPAMTPMRGAPPRVAKAVPKATEEGFHLNLMN